MRFESNVNSDSIQTEIPEVDTSVLFESNVNSDSIQTHTISCKVANRFESNVNSDSIQTFQYNFHKYYRLRVM